MAFDPLFTNYISYKIFDNAVDFIFLLDMIIMFITSFLNKSTGQEIFDSVEIAKKYITSVRFLTDFLAILGTDVVTNVVPNFQIFGLFKMIRVFRMGGMINRLNIHEKIKASLNLIKLVFYILLFLHVTACCLFIACHDAFEQKSDVLWYAPLHYINYPD